MLYCCFGAWLSVCSALNSAKLLRHGPASAETEVLQICSWGLRTAGAGMEQIPDVLEVNTDFSSAIQRRSKGRWPRHPAHPSASSRRTETREMQFRQLQLECLQLGQLLLSLLSWGRRFWQVKLIWLKTNFVLLIFWQTSGSLQSLGVTPDCKILTMTGVYVAGVYRDVICNPF